MHENAARTKTPRAHKSPKTAPRTHTRSHITHIKVSSDCTRNAQTQSTSKNLKKDVTKNTNAHNFQPTAPQAHTLPHRPHGNLNKLQTKRTRNWLVSL